MDDVHEAAPVTDVIATPVLSKEGQDVSLKYVYCKTIGNGSFGVVYEANLFDSGEKVAIKKVLQDKRYKNRELDIMLSMDHQNIVKLKYYFYSASDKDLFLNLVLEFVPETVYRINRNYRKANLRIPVICVKTYMFQLFRALGYIHSMDVCHRDIKPQNLLVDPNTAVLKLCDFGSAKRLVEGEPNVAYICSRYYRAPELLFGATEYTTTVDMWSAGCVLSELLSGTILFPGDSAIDQVVEIIKILGTPSDDDIHQMNPNYADIKFPRVTSRPWTKLFDSSVPQEAIDLISHLLYYTPNERISATQACCHGFFDELLQINSRLPNGMKLPPLTNFAQRELAAQPELNRLLVHTVAATGDRSQDSR